MSLGRTIYVSKGAGANQTTFLRGKPAPRGNRAIQGSYIIGDSTRPGSNRVGIPLVDIVGNEAFLTDVKKAYGASQISIADAAGNSLTPTQLIGLLEPYIMPPVLGPFQSPGTVLVNQYIAGSAVDGPVAQEPFVLSIAEITAQVANTVGSNVLTAKNLTTAVSVTFTFVAGAALFKRATASAQLQVSKGDKYSLQWTAVGGTPGSDVSVLLKTIEGS